MLTGRDWWETLLHNSRVQLAVIFYIGATPTLVYRLDQHRIIRMAYRIKLLSLWQGMSNPKPNRLESFAILVRLQKLKIELVLTGGLFKSRKPLELHWGCFGENSARIFISQHQLSKQMVDTEYKLTVKCLVDEPCHTTKQKKKSVCEFLLLFSRSKPNKASPHKEDAIPYSNRVYLDQHGQLNLIVQRLTQSFHNLTLLSIFSCRKMQFLSLAQRKHVPGSPSLKFCAYQN